MKTICIKIEDELHKQIKMETVLQNKSLKQYVIGLITKDLKTKKEQTQ